MKTILVSLFSLVVGQMLAQSSTVRGSVYEQESPVSFATVVLYAAEDSSIIKVEYTDDSGEYVLQVVPGSYYVEASFVGMTTQTSSVFGLSPDQTHSVEAFHLQSSSQELEEVTVTAKKPIVQILPDKTVFNVEGNVHSAGNSAFDLLRKSPGVVVDNNDNIILRGKSGVQIYINGKRSVLTGEDLVAFLRSLRSEDIKAIEIITSPSSKYDAEGNAGILNIELKREKGMGTTGSIGLGYALGITPKYNGSVRINNRSKKINAYGSYSLFTGDLENRMYFNRTLDVERIVQESVQVRDRENHNFRAGVDYFVNERHTVGVLVNGYYSQSDGRSEIQSDIFDLAQSEMTLQLNALDQGYNDRQNFNTNLNYEFKISEQEKINVDLDYGHFKADNFSFQPNDYVDPSSKQIILEQDYTTVAPTHIHIYTAKADYERLLWEGKLGAGIKYASVQSQNEFSFYNHVGGDMILDTDRSNDFDYTENVSAAYLNFASQKEKWGYQLGLRLESTNSIGNLEAVSEVDNKKVERNYTDLFPSAGLSYQLNTKNSLRLSYSRRIDRPNYQRLNPFEFRLDELTFRKGNPFLNPQYTNAIELSHQHNYKLNTSISYSKTTNLMTQLTDTIGTRGSFITFLNLAEQTTYGINVSYPIDVAPWWNVFANVSANKLINKGSFEGTKIVDINVNSANVYLQNTITLPHDWSFELSGFYQSPSVWGGNFETEAIGRMDVGVTKRLWQGRATVKASVNDVFLTMPWEATSTLGVLNMHARGRWESRQLRINFSYQLGQRDVRNARRRSSGMEQEKQRLSQED